MKRGFAVLFLVLLAGGGASADTVVLASGESVAGKIEGDHLDVETAGGRLSVPYSSLRNLSASAGGTVRLELIDGTSLQGTLVAESVSVHLALYNRIVPLHDIRTMEWDPPKATIPAGTAVSLELIRTLNSRSAAAGAPAEYCVAKPVVIDGKTVIADHAAAWGEVVGASGGRNVGSGGKIVLRASGVLAIDGTEVRLQGTHEAEGGFNGGAVVALGVLGLLTEANPAEAASGARFEGQTEQEAQVALTSRPVGDARAAAQRDCDDYYSLRTGDFVPAERLRHGGAFAPVPQPMRISVPILPVVRSAQRFSQSIPLGALTMEDLSIATAVLEINPKRNGGADLTVTANIYVRPSQDRLVNLEYQLVAGGQVVKAGKEPGIKAAEGRVKAAKTRFELTPLELASLAGAADPRLRITMTAIED